MRLKKTLDLLVNSYEYFKTLIDLWRYRQGGAKPWSAGYIAFRNQFIENTLKSRETLQIFASGRPLPPNFGIRLDERVVEYPWVFSKLNEEGRHILDAGSVLNFDYILRRPELADKHLVIYTLSPERVFKNARISYVYGDLRDSILKSETFDTIVCISTLEHVGMDNTLLYSNDENYRENSPKDYLKVLKELRRLLKSNGQLLLTVPYGKYENHGWLQQFDRDLLQSAVDTFEGMAQIHYYKYSLNGWQVSDQQSCDECAYYNIHATPEIQSDVAAAARAVACIQFTKS
ncbi:class I SAM-dependent methyltransferase [Anaerolineae bacterium CFX9]|nr:class I SAM-dependent methyltransferase [Oscillatoria laete-virens]MBC6961616.1 class I SAM-dependent methyltransferase [Nitrosomonas sp.]MDK3158179.1 class I SAM-dependent methyltransferase [Kamptonema cortianum]MDL1901218.1 class I SAM-dependent methyltransferase [Anaerolineae bacterium CFX9]MDL5054953.1 class I SAM-dependent methyltransferase [Oscillatoria laete-virens NRMC-F 0139]